MRSFFFLVLVIFWGGCIFNSSTFPFGESESRPLDRKLIGYWKSEKPVYGVRRMEVRAQRPGQPFPLLSILEADTGFSAKSLRFFLHQSRVGKTDYLVLESLEDGAQKSYYLFAFGFNESGFWTREVKEDLFTGARDAASIQEVLTRNEGSNALLGAMVSFVPDEEKE